MKIYNHTLSKKICALGALALYFITAVSEHQAVYSQPYLSYEKYSHYAVQNYSDRASSFADEKDWDEHVLSGLSLEKSRWENEALEQMQDKIRKIEMKSYSDEEKKTLFEDIEREYEAALEDWRRKSIEHYNYEKGRFLALKRISEPEWISEGVFYEIISSVEASVANSMEMNLDLWDQAAETARQKYAGEIENGIASEFARMRDLNINPEFRTGFEDELAERESEIRREYLMRENFYLLRARNQYITMRRMDDMSARLAADKNHAETAGEKIIEQTIQDVADLTDAVLADAEKDFNPADFSENADAVNAAELWQKKVEGLIDEGMKRWSKAEEEMFAQRLAWMQNRKESREEAMDIWRENEEKLKSSMQSWLTEVQKKISDGRKEWDGKYQEFYKEKKRAETGLAENIAAEQEKWLAFSSELSGIVNGGGAALLQAKDGYRFYTDLMEASGWLRGKKENCPVSGDGSELCTFYSGERIRLSHTILTFEEILMNAEEILSQTMVSDENYTGYLKDRREYAGNLPDRIKNLSEDDFRTELVDLMDHQDESFLLYRNDIDSLIRSNAYFTGRAEELRRKPDFPFEKAESIQELIHLTEGLAGEYDFQKAELLEIIAETSGRDGSPEDKLEAAVSSIQEWMEHSSDENARLRKKILEYFDGSLDGYYIIRNENDPYLMSRAEYEWELLRRERNYLSKRLKEAEAVKRYADLAQEHDAGIEIARITAERAEIERIRMEVRHLSFQILTGKIALLNEQGESSESVEYKINRLLGERGIHKEFLQAKRETLSGEIHFLSEMESLEAPPDGKTADMLIQKLHLLEQNGYESPLRNLRMKLADFRKFSENSSEDVSESSWKAIQGLAAMIRQELSDINKEYSLEALQREIQELEKLLERKSSPVYEQDLAAAAEELRINSGKVREAEEMLARAEKLYAGALLDFTAIITSDSENVLRAELKSTSAKLASVLKGMLQLEDITENGIFADTDEAAGYEYIKTISRGERAKQELVLTEQLLDEIRGHEDAKIRNDYLTYLLEHHDFNELQPLEIAQLIIDSKSDLLAAKNEKTGVNGTDAQSSAEMVLKFIEFSKNKLIEANKEMTGMLQTDGFSTIEIELIKKEISELEIAIIAGAGNLIGIIRGEEIYRQKRMRALIDGITDDAGFRENILKERDEYYAGLALYEKSVAETSELISSRIASYLHEMHDKNLHDFNAILAEINVRISGMENLGFFTSPGYGLNDAELPSEKEILSLVRAWICQNRSVIDRANELPARDDYLSVEEKWKALLQASDELNRDALFFRKFSEGIPREADDAWVLNYKNVRMELLENLDVLSGMNPEIIYESYLNLSHEKREMLARYGSVDPSAAGTSLMNIKKIIMKELSVLDINFRSVYLREAIYENQRITDEINPVLMLKLGDLEKAVRERSLLRLDLKENAFDALRKEEITSRIEYLDAVIEELEDITGSLKLQRQAAQNSIRESQIPGSTSVFYGQAASLFVQEEKSLRFQGNALGMMQKILLENAVYEAAKSSQTDFLKIAMGFYETNSFSEILKDREGRPVISEDFVRKYSTDTNLLTDENFISEISKNRNGGELLVWAERLSAWISESENNNAVSEELRAAAALLESSIRETMASEKYIEIALESGYSDLNAMIQDAQKIKVQDELQLKNLSAFLEFEEGLYALLNSTSALEGDFATAVLSFLENSKNIPVFILGKPTEPESPAEIPEMAANRMDQYRTLADRLRESRMDKFISETSEIYLRYKQDESAGLLSDSEIADAFFNEIPELDADKLLKEISNLNKTDFRNQLLVWIKTIQPHEAILAGEVISVLTKNSENGTDLYDKIKERLLSAAENMKNSIRTLAGLSDESSSSPDIKLQNEFLHSLALLDASAVYHAEEYPESYRNVILLRAFFRAEENYRKFIELHDSDLNEDKKNASLNLLAMNGVFSSFILSKDINKYLSQNPSEDFLADAAVPRSIADYAEAYFRDRNTNKVLISNLSLILYENAALEEYKRIQTDSQNKQIYLLDETKYFSDFRQYLFLNAFEHYVNKNQIIFSGSDLSEKQKQLENAFQVFLHDDFYSVNGRTLSERFTDGSERAALLQKAFILIEENQNSNAFLPEFLLSESGEIKLYKTPEDYLPEELKSIPDYKTAGYEDHLAELPEEVRTVLALVDAEEILNANASGIFLSDEKLIRLFEEERFAGEDETTKQEIREFMKMKMDLSLSGGILNENKLVLSLRAQKVFNYYFPSESEKEKFNDFTMREGIRAGIIQEKILNAVHSCSSALQNKAKLNRGEFFGALIDLFGNHENQYFLSLPLELKDEMTVLKNQLFSVNGNSESLIAARVLTEDEILSLAQYREMYEKYFQYSSSMELAANSLFSEAGSSVLLQFERFASDEILESALNSRSSLLTDFMNAAADSEEKFALNGLQIQMDVPDQLKEEYLQSLQKAVREADPFLLNMIKEESEMVKRMLSLFLETDEDLFRINKIIKNPGILYPSASSRFFPENSQWKVLAEENENRILHSIKDRVSDFAQFHKISRNRLERELEVSLKIKNHLMSFSGGENSFSVSSFSSYRTFLGNEQQDMILEYERYRDNITYQNKKSREENPLDPSKWLNTEIKSYEEFFGGNVINYDTLNPDQSASDILKKTNWREFLTSDNPEQRTSGILKESGSSSEKLPYAVFSKKRIASRFNDGMSDAEWFQELHYANLANYYLESLTGLNQSIAAVFRAAMIADQRTSDEFKDSFRDKVKSAFLDYEKNARTDELLAMTTESLSNVSANGREAVDSAYHDFLRASGEIQDSEESFASAARRKMIVERNAGGFLENVLSKSSDEFHEAQKNLERVSDEGTALRKKQSEISAEYADVLNDAALLYSRYSVSRDAYETARAVFEYAETPYLLSTGESESLKNNQDERAGDADRQYGHALARFMEAQKKMDEASYQVRIESGMDELENILKVLASDDSDAVSVMQTPLSEDEKKELEQLKVKKYKSSEDLDSSENEILKNLSLRNDYERYSDLVTARLDFVKHSLRMIRLRKARDIVNEEIKRRRVVADVKREEFYGALNALMPASSKNDENSEEVTAARNAVYSRLVRLIESGGNLADEFRGWYYTESAWQDQARDTFQAQLISDYKKAEFPQISPLQAAEAAAGLSSSKAISLQDKKALMLWLMNGNTMQRYEGFRNSYYSYLLSLGEVDRYQEKLALTLSAFTPVLLTGQALVAAGTAMVASGAALSLSVVGAPAGAVMIQNGLIQISFGYPMVSLAMQNITMSTEELLLTFFSSLGFAYTAYEFGSDTSGIEAVRVRQKEYEKAMFELEYLTKISDVQTFKKRLMEFGKNTPHSMPGSPQEEALYVIQEDDLDYLYETEINGRENYVNSSGADLSHVQGVKEEGLDISVNRKYVIYADAYGSSYDPHTLLDAPPGHPDGGFYTSKDGLRYIKVFLPDSEGRMTEKYALAADGEPDNKFAAYSMDDILNSAAAHGEILRVNRKNKYFREGDALNNPELSFKERESTFSQILEQASGRLNGGREFEGYRIAFTEKNRNALDIFGREMMQRKEIQLKEWQLRLLDLDAARKNWEEKTSVILDRGRKSWGGVIARFSQERRRWEQEFDEATEKETERRDEIVSDFYTRRENWQIQMQALSAETAVHGDISHLLDELNEQLAAFERSLGIGMEKINVEFEIRSIVDEIKQSAPGETERLKNINSSIHNFSIALYAGAVSHGNIQFGLDSIRGKFSEALKIHEKSMRTLFNVKAFEQFRELKEKIISQIKTQDRATEESTEAAAYASGFVKRGGVFIKSLGSLTATAAVNPYTRFDISGNLSEVLAETGFQEMQESDLVEFLRKKNEMEVSAYFSTQRNALLASFEKLMGKGSLRERENSRDAKIVGRYGLWAGKAPDQKRTQLAEKASAGFSGFGGNASILSAYAGNGYGELGSSGLRPSGIFGGFYVQLQFAGEEISKNSAKEIQNAAGTLDPFSVTMNSINPLTLAANSYYNVEVGSRLYGYDRGSLIEAQGIGIARTGLIAGGSVLVAAGGPAGWIVGSLMILAGNSIQVNLQTGERETKLTDEAAVSSAVQIGTAAAGGAIANGTAGALSQSPMLSLAGTSSGAALFTSGMKYDENGSYDGFSMTGMDGERAILNAAAAGLTSLAGSAAGNLSGSGGFAGSYANQIISSGSNAFTEYLKLQRYGENYSNYASLQRSDLTSIGSFAGGIAAAKLFQIYVAHREAKLSDLRETMPDHPANPVEKSNEADRAHRGMSALWGAYEGIKEWMKSRMSGFYNFSDDSLPDPVNEMLRNGEIVPYGQDQSGRPVYYNSRNGFFVNSDGVISGANGKAVELSDNSGGLSAPDVKTLTVVSGWNKEQIRSEISKVLGREVSMSELDSMQMDGYGGFKGTIADRIAKDKYVWAGDKIILPGSSIISQSEVWSLSGILNGIKQVFMDVMGYGESIAERDSYVSKEIMNQNGTPLPLRFGQKYNYVQGFGNDHFGIDLGVVNQTPILSTIDGKIHKVIENSPSYGNNVIVRNQNGLFIRVAHLSEISVLEGMEVQVGSLLGLSGDTGSPGSFHVHYEVVEGVPDSDWSLYWSHHRNNHRDPFTFSLR